MSKEGDEHLQHQSPGCSESTKFRKLPCPPDFRLPETLEALLDEGYQSDPLPNSILKALRDDDGRHHEITLAECEERSGRLYYRERLYIPDSDNLKAEVLRRCHEAPLRATPARRRLTTCCPEISTGPGCCGTWPDGSRSATPVDVSTHPVRLVKEC